MRYFLFLILFLCVVANGSEVCLRGKLAQAPEGSFLVLEQNKIFTFFHIHQRSETALIFEEVSIPAATVGKKGMNWKAWFESGAPGHTCWLMSEIDLSSGACKETFSFTHKGWIDTSDSNSFLTTLLNLRFFEIPREDRRKVGLAPPYHQEDRRPIWHPRLVVEGHIIPYIAFRAYKARWPADGSELSRKDVEIYLPEPQANQENSPYPLYFPYWLEIEGKIGSAKVRVIDSGFNACSPKSSLPKRRPQLLGNALLDEKGVVFHLKSPCYFKNFFVLAEECSGFFGSMIPLPCEVSEEKDGSLSLLVPREEIKHLAGRYRFTISPKEDPSLVLESLPLEIGAL
jgi:hypothetical protein